MQVFIENDLYIVSASLVFAVLGLANPQLFAVAYLIALLIPARENFFPKKQTPPVVYQPPVPTIRFASCHVPPRISHLFQAFC